MTSSREQLEESEKEGKKWVKEAEEAKTWSKLKSLRIKFKRLLAEAEWKERPGFEQADRWQIEKRCLVEALEIVGEKILKIKENRRIDNNVALIIIASSVAAIFGILSAIFNKVLEMNFMGGILLGGLVAGGLGIIIWRLIDSMRHKI